MTKLDYVALGVGMFMVLSYTYVNDFKTAFFYFLATAFILLPSFLMGKDK